MFGLFFSSLLRIIPTWWTAILYVIPVRKFSFFTNKTNQHKVLLEAVHLDSNKFGEQIRAAKAEVLSTKGLEKVDDATTQQWHQQQAEPFVLRNLSQEVVAWYVWWAPAADRHTWRWLWGPL